MPNSWLGPKTLFSALFGYIMVYLNLFGIWKWGGPTLNCRNLHLFILTSSQRRYAYMSTRWDVDVTHNDYLGWPHPPLPSGPSETVCSDIGWWRRSTFHLVCQFLGFVSDQIQWSIGKSIRYILFLIKNEIPETKSFFPSHIDKTLPKTLRTLTNSTPIVQSRSFNKLWNLGQAWLCLAKGKK